MIFYRTLMSSYNKNLNAGKFSKLMLSIQYSAI